MDLEERAVVAEVKDDRAVVRVVESSHCSGCASAGFCHGGGTEKRVEVDNAAGAKTGDQVVLAVPSGPLLKASFQVYVLPVFGLLAGAGAAQLTVQRLAGPEAAGAAAGIGGLAGAILTIFLLRVILKRRSAGTAIRPRIVRII